jgi:aspartate/methionine/tyrosine aminotransferase
LGLLPVSHTILFPLETVGEVKYGNLNFRSFATGLGQIIGYLKASQFEAVPKIYGYYIFFNTDVDKTITENDKKFLEELWENENIFVVII